MASPSFDPSEIERLRAAMDLLDPAGPPRANLLRKAREGIGAAGGCLAILDASFNPMTLAHRGMVCRAKEACSADETLLMLSRANVDKGVFGADLGQRLAMLLHYAGSRPGTSVAGCSHARFVDKARALRPLYPAGTRLHFIIGYDTLQRLFDPKYYADMQQDLTALFGLAHIVAANRGAGGLEEMRALLDRPECRPFAGRVRLIRLPDDYAAMSSTEVRERCRRGEPIRDLVPPEIAESIETLRLYRN